MVTAPSDEATARFEQALATLAHRGPDAMRFFSGRAGPWKVTLGHTRLAVQDLNEAAHQPFVERGARGERALVFNGELYDHSRQRKTMAPRQWRTTSDTETLIVALTEDPEQAAARFNGMFAFGYVDFEARCLVLGRDRLGKKPLYLVRRPRFLAFASELKALRALVPDLDVDPEAIAWFHRQGFIPGRKTIYLGCERVAAGTTLRFDLSGALLDAGRERPFWDPFVALGRGTCRNEDDVLDELDELLDDATKLRLISDVPVGAFLSSGVDSSLVASSLARVGAGEVTTFSVGTTSAEDDESHHAARTAHELGLPHEILHLGPGDFKRQLARVAWHFDEPLADLSIVPTLAISEAARRRVTVVLTGDGGDEGFVGYPWLSRMPEITRVGALLGPAARYIGGTARRLAVTTSGGSRAVRLAAQMRLLGARDSAQALDWYRALDDSVDVQLPSVGDALRSDYPHYSWDQLFESGPYTALSALELVGFMRDAILVKVDRATMAYALEARSPLLDHRIVALGLSLPDGMKVRRGVHKWLLRRLLGRRLGPRLTALAKRGFVVPMPPDLPPGPNERARWAKWVAVGWSERWDRSLGLEPRS